MEQRTAPGQEKPDEMPATVTTPESLLSVLGVVYVHRKTSDGGDIYLTRFGLPVAELLKIENWYEHDWFVKHRERLEGTSAVYRVPTKTVQGRSLELVVKNCRVGEDVPLDTHTLLDFLNAEFNSPWEEFALVMEMREGKFGTPDMVIKVQEPLAIYVPPDKMQIWQSGRSQSKINQIRARHPGIDLDILRQYKLIYGWIAGQNIIDALAGIGFSGDELAGALKPLTNKSIEDLEQKGYAVADMKPAHVIIVEENMERMNSLAGPTLSDTQRLRKTYVNDLISQGLYSIIDYELLLRTAPHEQLVNFSRRHSYLDDQRDRFVATGLPSHLNQVEILGVPYVHGFAESTGGQLWVVGRNGRLFDYFLPERWRKTHPWRLSESNEVYYTVTKDQVHIVWKESRVGEQPAIDRRNAQAARIEACGFNSPFEEVAIVQDLSSKGIPTIYMRAIYMTGSAKVEQSTDLRRYESHRALSGTDGFPILREDHNYITLRGYYNGPDTWVAQQTGNLCRPLDLAQALARKIIDQTRYDSLLDTIGARLGDAGYDGTLLEGNDMLLAIDPAGEILTDSEGNPEVRICNFELIQRL